MNQMPEALPLAGPLNGGNPRPGGDASENQNPKRIKNPKKTTTAFDKRAQAKIKDAKALLTDAKTWGHKVDPELAKGAASDVFLS